jgi:FHS family L-fucose permease-like MFS transporter
LKLFGVLELKHFGAILLSGIDGVNEKLNTASADEKATLLNTMADSVVTPYIVMAVVLVFLLEDPPC